jgi:hypothetical protein
MRRLVRSWRKLTLHPRAYGWSNRPKPAWAVTAATTWTTITAGGRELGTMTSCPGSWVAAQQRRRLPRHIPHATRGPPRDRVPEDARARSCKATPDRSEGRSAHSSWLPTTQRPSGDDVPAHGGTARDQRRCHSSAGGYRHSRGVGRSCAAPTRPAGALDCSPARAKGSRHEASVALLCS